MGALPLCCIILSQFEESSVWSFDNYVHVHYSLLSVSVQPEKAHFIFQQKGTIGIYTRNQIHNIHLLMTMNASAVIGGRAMIAAEL